MALNDEQRLMLDAEQEFRRIIESTPKLKNMRDSYYKKCIAEVRRQGRLQELKDVVKAHPECSISLSENGNIVVFAVIGKRLLRRIEIVFQLFDEEPASFLSIVKIKRDAMIFFLTEQQKLDGAIMFNKNMSGREVLTLNKERFEIDSKLYLAAKMLSECEIVQSSESSQDAKLFAAYELNSCSKY